MNTKHNPPNIPNNISNNITKRLTELGLVLPKINPPMGNYKLGIQCNNLVFMSGQVAVLEDGTLATGIVGKDVSVETAYQHARRAGLGLIAAMQELLGDLNQVQQIVKLVGMVNAVPSFTQHPQVINGCSDLFFEVFEAAGLHARSALGVSSLPGGTTVEVEAIIALHKT